MNRFIESEDRLQATLLPDSLEDYVTDDNPVRVIDVFIDELDLAAMGFAGVAPEATGRPAYHPATLLKIYLYGYLNRIQSSRRLERETQRNIELMWLTGMVQEHRGDHASQWAAIASIAAKIGCSGETLRNWVRQAERDAGVRPGATTDERERIKALERENRELRQANEILRKASAYFAQAELDRRFKP